jgi:predicted RecB family nuclease
MLDIREIKKDTLHAVMLQQLYALNYVWLRFEGLIQQKAPEAYMGEEHYQLYEDYGSEEARRLVKALGFPREEIKDLVRFLQHSHWAVFENIEIAELTASSFRVRTLDCSAQRAAKKWGLEYYDCGTGGLRIRNGFYKGINPRAKVQRIFTPPEARPEGRPALASCEWLISLE